MPAILSADEQLAFWTDLEDFIRADALVPVVGVELLEVATEDGTLKNFYTAAAETFAKNEGLASPSLTGTRALNQVASDYLQQKRGDEVQTKVRRVLQTLEKQLALPDALLKLAALPLKLFVTTTCDDLLAEAIERQQPRWKGLVRRVHYSPERLDDISSPGKDGPPVVFHLFGRARSMAEYAVTDEDVLEFMLALHSHERRPAALFRQLHRQNLLFLGCGFPDWLTRFFVRLGKQERFSTSGAKTDWLVDSSTDNSEFVTFLDHFSRRTRCFPLTPREFAEAIGAHLPAAASEPMPRAAISGVRDPERDILQGAVFLSYASEDRVLAELIRDALMANDVDCWFDRQQLELGDDWERKIVRNIKACVLFMPLLTVNTQTRASRFFRHEWRHALTFEKGLPEDAKFIVPVALPNVLRDDPALPEAFQRVQWQILASEQTLEPSFISAVVRIYQQAQIDRQGRGGSL